MGADQDKAPVLLVACAQGAPPDQEPQEGVGRAPLALQVVETPVAQGTPRDQAVHKEVV